MNIFLSQLLTWLQTYGYLAVWLTLCVAALGVPLPIDLVLLAAGAFSAQGDFNLMVLALVASGGSICGDTLGYGIGRRWGHQVLNWLERPSHRHILPPRLVAPARSYFARRGGWAIFLSRILLSSVGGEINLLAGANPYPFRRFVLADASGEIIGALIPLCLGYWFGASWEAAGNLLNSLSIFVLGIICVLFLAWTLVNMMRHDARQPEKTLLAQPPERSPQARQTEITASKTPHARQDHPSQGRASDSHARQYRAVPADLERR